MKLGRWEVPPRSSPGDEAPRIKEEAGMEIFRPKPGALNIDSLVETAKAGETIDMVPELDEYYDAWVHYAQDRNVFIGNESMRALADARREAIQLAREKKYEELRAKLAELSGERAADVEKAVEEHLSSIHERTEATHKENKEALAGAVNEVEGLHPRKEPSPERALGRNAEREMRAQRFAEKYGIAAERQALLIAEENYAAAIRHRNESFFKLKLRDDAATKGQREILESAIQKWRAALSMAGQEAAENDEKQDALAARFIGARDSMMRMEQIRQRAVAEGLDARSKTTIGKIDAWANKLNAKLLGGAAAAGKGFGRISEAVGGAVVGRFLDKEEDAAKYQRASRIVGSAAIMTAIFAPFGAVTAGAAGMTFVWRTARGLLGWGAGSAAGAGVGKLYDLRHGSEGARLQEHLVNQKELVQALRTGKIEMIDQKLLAAMYEKGSATQFSKTEREHAERKMRAETAAAALVAGASAYGISHFPPVHEALTNHPVAPVSPETSAPAPVEHAPAGVHPAPPQHVPEAVVPAVHIESVSVHGTVNDADKLFGRFMENVRTQFPDEQSAPPALRALLEQYHQVDGMHQQDVLTRFLHLQNGGSVVVHPGDTLSYEDGKVIFQGHTLIDEQGTVQNLRQGGQIHIEHPQVETAPSAPEETQPQAEAPSPEQPAPQTVIPPLSPEPQLPVASVPETMPMEQAAPPVEAPHEAVPAPAPEPPAAPEHIEQPVPAPAPEVHAAPVPEQSVPEQAVPQASPEHVTHEAAPAQPMPSNDNTPAPEAFSTPSSNIAPVENLTHSPLWDVAHARGAYQLFDTPVPVTATDAAAFRQNLFDLMKASGVGPNSDETIEHYLARAQEAIAKGNIVKPVIVETPDQMLIAHGGDLNARMVLSREFLREYQIDHPDQTVAIVVENDPGVDPRVTPKAVVMTSDMLNAKKDDGIYYPSFEELHIGDHKVALPTVTPEMKVIF